jgi:tetracycline 7-halogenase / FADH2 O2-dependent halogenase
MPSMPKDFDIAVVGSGFGGSLIAMIARQLGRSVILIERGRHPRFAIGESSTPLANLLLEELAREYHLDALLPLTKWGTWQTQHPEIGCGLKRGFTFYHHQLGKPWRPDELRRNELLVAASPHDRVADTHWYRADVDHFFVRETQRLGVEFVEETELDAVEFSAESVRLSGSKLSVRAGFVLDASGPRGFLHRALELGEIEFENFPATQALYTHFQNVERWENLPCCSGGAPPYPVDDAAVHHIFPGGWIWVLRFNNGITSAGVAATRSVNDGAKSWARLLALLPSLQEQFARAKPVLPFFHLPKVAFRTTRVVGPQWAMLPSAAASIDPLLSTGFPLTLWSVSRLAETIAGNCNPAALADYERITFTELDRAANLVARLYARFEDFEGFCEVAMTYFAAASYAEAARRLNRREKALSFLAGLDEPLDKINVAGLADPARRNWYPCKAEDLLGNSWKLGVTRKEVQEMLQRVGF